MTTGIQTLLQEMMGLDSGSIGVDIVAAAVRNRAAGWVLVSRVDSRVARDLRRDLVLGQPADKRNRHSHRARGADAYGLEADPRSGSKAGVDRFGDRLGGSICFDQGDVESAVRRAGQ